MSGRTIESNGLRSWPALASAPASIGALAISALVLGACGARAAEVRSGPQLQVSLAAPQAAPSVTEIALEPLAPGVTMSEPSCTEGAYDACNGLDDDCDARIDEGCGWESGSVQITLAWETAADLDLYVIDPDGYTVSYMDRASPVGARLDHDARGACVPGTDTIENVYFETPTPPRGRYAIDVHYWGECGTTGATPARLSVSVGGHLLGVYDFTLQPGQRQSVAVFSL